MKREDLPNDIERLKALIMQQSDEIKILSEQVSFWKNFALVRKTEKKAALHDDPQQLWLFNEAEAHAEDPEPEEPVQVQQHQRKRGTRRPLPEFLERRVTVLDIPEEEKKCGCGTQLTEIRRDLQELRHGI